jgi:hypothetical protein
MNLGFTTEGRLADVLMIPSSWGSQQAVTYKPSLILTLVLMEMLEGGWRSLPEVIPVAFPPPIFSSGSRQTLCFGVFDLYAASLCDPQGDPFYSRF